MSTSKCISVPKEVVVISLSLIICVFGIYSFLFPIVPNMEQYSATSPSSDVQQESLDGLAGPRSPLSAPNLPIVGQHSAPSPSSDGGPLSALILPNAGRYSAPSPSSNVQEDSLDGLAPFRSPLSADNKESSFWYRNAPWKSGIGRWLSQCGKPSNISVSECLFNYKCDNDCGARGVCNHELGECRCFLGFSGKGCEREEEFSCGTDENFWRPSRCGASCDKTTAFCYCGDGTKYPRRPVSQGCGFATNNGEVDWNTPDPLIFSNSSSKEGTGWCNLDPHVIRESWQEFKAWQEKCDCRYDGTWGPLCDIPVESVCINQCSGNGQCRGGFCVCGEGWHGIDCSVPSSLQSLNSGRWPSWLGSSRAQSRVNITMSDSHEEITLKLTVEKRRPLIYVYDLPPKFNSHLLEGRHNRYWCTTRIYGEYNSTDWTRDLYGSEPALLESLLASPHRTTNAEEADFFYVPTFEACARFQADSAPRTDMQRKYGGLRSYFAGSFHKQAYEIIKEQYPYWNRSGGRDHIWLFAWDEGACSAPKEIWSSIMLVHWGNMMSKHNYSTSAYEPDRWSNIPTEWRGNHPCYDPSKDIVIPSWKQPDPNIRKQLPDPNIRPRGARKILFYFNGNLGNMYEPGRPEIEYSMGLRQKLGEEFGSVRNKNGKIGRQAARDVVVTHRKSQDYGLELSRSRFCGVFPGDGWSGRMEDSILHGCIPVIVQDGIHLPFENVLDYSAFTVRIAENDLPNLVRILRGIHYTRVDSMLSNVLEIWQRFTYHNNVKLEARRLRVKREAQRQRLGNQFEAPWETVYSNLRGDDAFATLIQVLDFKRSYRPWQTTSEIVGTNSSHARDHCMWEAVVSTPD